MGGVSSPTPELGTSRRRAPQSELSANPSELTRVGWTPSANLGLAEWSAVGRRFGEIGRCSQWWLGDWINYGNAKFGERYSRAMKLTGYDVQSLMNMVYVASRFEISRRRENLSWSHHATLAPLDVPEQEYWLTRAIKEKLSVADLRVELRGMRRSRAVSAGGSAEQAEQVEGDEVHTLVCPNCGEAVPLSH
ncbi:MAG: LmbU family transcriptional regulator [Solirubrobacteraceae bacterium]